MWIDFSGFKLQRKITNTREGRGGIINNVYYAVFPADNLTKYNKKHTPKNNIL